MQMCIRDRFNVQPNYWTGGNTWTGGVGLLYLILGPIVVRLSFDMMMMVFLLVKNVISINHNLASQSGSADGDVFGVPDMQEDVYKRQGFGQGHAAHRYRVFRVGLRLRVHGGPVAGGGQPVSYTHLMSPDCSSLKVVWLLRPESSPLL